MCSAIAGVGDGMPQSRTVTVERQRIPLPAVSPGDRRHLQVLRFGAGTARPKAYLHTGLHADENPGMLVMHHLIPKLEAAARTSQLNGQVVLVPVANPIGLGQTLHGRLLGRFEFVTGANFNRGYPDLAAMVQERVSGALGADSDANVDLIRAAMVEALDAMAPIDEAGALRQALLRLACDADICLDLHCDFEAVLHVYLGTPLWPGARDLAAELGSSVTLLAEVSGGHPFDEAVGGVWWALARRFPDHPIPPACVSATIELRGETDIDDDTAARDAGALYRYLCRRGVIDDDPGPLPGLSRDATPLEGVDMIRADRPGVVVYHRAPGDSVEQGECVAEIVDPLEPDPARSRSRLSSRTTGTLFARHNRRFACPGQIVCKVAGPEPLTERKGKLLSD